MGQHPEVLLEAMEQQVQQVICGLRDAAAEGCDDVAWLEQQAAQLLHFCQEESLLDLVVQHGGVEAVAPLLTAAEPGESSLAEASKYACSVVASVAIRPEFKRGVFSSDALPGLLQLLSPGVAAVQPGVSRRAVEALAALAQDSRSMKALLRECGALDCIVGLLASSSSSEPQTQRAALAALRTFTDGNTTNKAYLVECGGLEALVKVLLCGEDGWVHQKGLHLLGELVANDRDLRLRALQAGVMRPLLRLLAVGSSAAQRGAALLVGQFAAPPLEEGALAVAAGPGRVISIEHDIIPALIPLLSARSSGVQEMAAFALARLAQLTSYQAAIVQYEGLAPLLGALASPSSGVQYNAAFALYELAEGQELALAVAQAGALQHLNAASTRAQGPVQACLQHTITRLEQHAAAAQAGGAVTAAAGHLPRLEGPSSPGATAEAGPLGFSLTPLCVSAAGFDDCAGSPLAETIFGGKGGRREQQMRGSLDACAHQQDQMQLHMPAAAAPLRQPSFDAFVGEAAAAEAAAAGNLGQQQAVQHAAAAAGLDSDARTAAGAQLAVPGKASSAGDAAAAAAAEGGSPASLGPPGQVQPTVGLALGLSAAMFVAGAGVVLFLHPGLLLSLVICTFALLILQQHLAAAGVQGWAAASPAPAAPAAAGVPSACAARARGADSTSLAASGAATSRGPIRRTVSFCVEKNQRQQGDECGVLPGSSSSGGSTRRHSSPNGSIWDAAVEAAAAAAAGAGGGAAAPQQEVPQQQQQQQTAATSGGGAAPATAEQQHHRPTAGTNSSTKERSSTSSTSTSSANLLSAGALLAVLVVATTSLTLSAGPHRASHPAIYYFGGGYHPAGGDPHAAGGAQGAGPEGQQGPGPAVASQWGPHSPPAVVLSQPMAGGEAYSAGHAVLGLVLVAAAVAWLMQVVEGLKQQQQQQQTQIQAEEKQQLLLPDGAAAAAGGDGVVGGSTQQEAASDQGDASTGAAGAQQQQQREREREGLACVGPRKSLLGTRTAQGGGGDAAPAAPAVAPPRHLDPANIKPSPPVAGSTTSSGSSKERKQRTTMQAAVAAAEKVLDSSGSSGSKLTMEALQQHIDAMKQGGSSSKAGASAAPSSKHPSQKSARSSRSRDTVGGSGSSGRARDLQALSPQVTVQGRFAAPPGDTAVVTSWELMEHRTASGLLAPTAPGSTSRSSSSKTAAAGQGGSGSPKDAVKASGGARDNSKGGCKSGPATPKATTPKAAAAQM